MQTAELSKKKAAEFGEHPTNPQVMAGCLQLFLNLVWSPPQSLLVAFATPLIVSTTALAAAWACLLKGLRNRAMIRGVWCQIYAVVGAASVGLLIVLFL